MPTFQVYLQTVLEFPEGVIAAFETNPSICIFGASAISSLNVAVMVTESALGITKLSFAECTSEDRVGAVVSGFPFWFLYKEKTSVAASDLCQITSSSIPPEYSSIGLPVPPVLIAPT